MDEVDTDIEDGQTTEQVEMITEATIDIAAQVTALTAILRELSARVEVLETKMEPEPEPEPESEPESEPEPEPGPEPEPEPAPVINPKRFRRV